MNRAAEESRRAINALTALSEMAGEGDVLAAKILVETLNHAAKRLRFLVNHFSIPARIAIEEAAATADHWPVSIPAMEEFQEPAISQALPAMLGASLPERMHPPNTGSGSTRYPHKEDTNTGFTLPIVMLLREALPFHEEDDKLALAERINKSEDVDLAEMFADGQAWQCESKLAHAGYTKELTDARRMKSVLMFKVVWAIAGDLKPLTADTASQWAEACILWAEAACVGDWENYPWPAGILERASKLPNRFRKSPRGCKVVVGEWIRAGIESITGFPCSKPRQTKPL